jgi:HD-GYP domain-containing protein (c-di-GMP phosphodiesterase class II)
MNSQEDKKVVKIEQDVINQLSVILRTAQIHAPGNTAITTVVEKFTSLIHSAKKPGQDISLEIRGEFIYIDGIRIRYSIENLFNYNFFIREFRKREVGTVTFKGSLASKDIQLFLKAFIESVFSETPYEEMSDLLAETSNIEIERLRKIQSTHEGDSRKTIKKTYYNAVSYTKGVMAKLRAGERVEIKKAKRIMETMVDQLLKEESLLLSMTAIKNYDEYTYHHSVNVSILSIALGQRLGFSKKMITELGLIALFHDIGKIEIPYEILNKPTNFNADEWKIIQKHPVWGVRAILKFRNLDNTVMRSAIVAFEHHMNYDFTGYPKVRKHFSLDFYTRIISLADQYDAMTSSRVYSRIPMAPDKALSIMMERAGTQLDPLLFKFFINMVGVFPIGTLVMLDTKELGLVYESGVVSAERPRVLIIVDNKGERVQGPVTDLTEKDKNGKYYRSIVKTLDPNKYKINLAEYLL